MIEVEVVLAWPQRVLSCRLKLEEGATVADAIAAAALEGSADCPAAAVHGVWRVRSRCCWMATASSCCARCWPIPRTTAGVARSAVDPGNPSLRTGLGA